MEGHAQELKVEQADHDSFVEDVRRALFASKIIAYSQGFDEIAQGAHAYNWTIDKGSVARIWRAGCIIRATFLSDIGQAYDEDPDLPLLMAAEPFASRIEECIPSLRKIVALAATHGIPTPVFSSCLAYFDTVRADRLPAALIQGQRDFFGAHTYRRVDREGTFHTRWADEGKPEEQWD